MDVVINKWHACELPGPVQHRHARARHLAGLDGGCPHPPAANLGLHVQPTTSTIVFRRYAGKGQYIHCTYLFASKAHKLCVDCDQVARTGKLGQGQWAERALRCAGAC